ncbi:MAG TPA: hypothetical protein VGP63_16025, partial [Planctomycetaceae bacterium]|nr:hypothetical protein [Planctomycetaceae bacterium]
MNAGENGAGTRDESTRASTWVGPSDATFIASFAPMQQQDATNARGNAACPQGDEAVTTSTTTTCIREYKTLRYEEDYSFLKDPSKCCDCWDPVKYIPLFGCDSGDYLTIGGELRERYEFFRNENAGAAPADSHGK